MTVVLAAVAAGRATAAGPAIAAVRAVALLAAVRPAVIPGRDHRGQGNQAAGRPWPGGPHREHRSGRLPVAVPPADPDVRPCWRSRRAAARAWCPMRAASLARARQAVVWHSCTTTIP